MDSLHHYRSGRSTAGERFRRLATLWLALTALSAMARAYAVPVDAAVPDELDAFDADDDELALDQEVRTVTDHRRLGESRKCYCGFSNLF